MILFDPMLLIFEVFDDDNDFLDLRICLDDSNDEGNILRVKISMLLIFSNEYSEIQGKKAQGNHLDSMLLRIIHIKRRRKLQNWMS
jgi:hypothetical protein